MVNKDTTCGLFNWRPDFLQPLASKKVYMFFYGVCGIVQGIFFTYLSATLSTLEKKFGIKSKVSIDVKVKLAVAVLVVHSYT